MKITKETISRMNELGYNVWPDDVYGGLDDINFSSAPYIIICSKDKEEGYFCKTFKTPKEKEVTVEWLLSKVNKGNNYKSLYEYFAKIANKHNISVYPASYGIGVASLSNRIKDIKAVSDKLSSLGLKYRTETSYGGWVYRFIIGKDRDNIHILESLKAIQDEQN